MPHNVVAQPTFRSDLSEALRCGFLETDRQFLIDAHAGDANGKFEDGTTAIVVAIRNGRYYAANAGDSRAILVKASGEVVELSKDHKPNDPDERRRVEAAGGVVIMPRGHGVWRVQVRARRVCVCVWFGLAVATNTSSLDLDLPLPLSIARAHRVSLQSLVRLATGRCVLFQF